MLLHDAIPPANSPPKGSGFPCWFIMKIIIREIFGKGNNNNMAKFKINNISLTKRDLDVMTILWGSEEPETASMIVRDNPNLTMNTVQAVLRKLLKGNFIKVADIVYSGTVLTRSYKPMVSQEDFWLQKIISDYQEIQQKVSKAAIVDALLGIDKNTESIAEDIVQIKEVLDKYAGK